MSTKQDAKHDEAPKALTNAEKVEGLGRSMRAAADKGHTEVGSPIALVEPVDVEAMKKAAEGVKAKFERVEDQTGKVTYVVRAEA